MSAALVEAELRGAPLAVRMEFAARLGSEVSCYIAAAVQDGRSLGMAWADVALATGVSTDTARTTWNAERVKRLLERRTHQQPVELPRTPHTPRGQQQPESAPGQFTQCGLGSGRLASALSYLQRTSQVSVAEAARQADVSPSYVSRILSGERLPSWPVVHTLVTIFGGRAEDVRLLWERAESPAVSPRQSVGAAAGRLHAALRGLHLAAARPDAVVLCEGMDLSPDTVRAILSGELIPDWPTTAHLVKRLQAPPADIRPLWESVHYAFLAAADSFPLGGVAHPDPRR